MVDLSGQNTTWQCTLRNKKREIIIYTLLTAHCVLVFSSTMLQLRVALELIMSPTLSWFISLGSTLYLLRHVGYTISGPTACSILAEIWEQPSTLWPYNLETPFGVSDSYMCSMLFWPRAHLSYYDNEGAELSWSIKLKARQLPLIKANKLNCLPPRHSSLDIEI